MPSLPTPVFPSADWDGNPQDTSNDGAEDATLAQAGDHNESAAEVLEVERLLRGKVASAHGGAVVACINKTGGALTCKKWVCLDGVDATTGLAKMTLGAADAASCRDGLGLLVMESGGDVDSVADGGVGYVVQIGVAYGLATDGMGAAGTMLWPAASGGLSSTPVAGCLPVAEVDVSHATLGVLRVFANRGKLLVADHTLDEGVDLAFGTTTGTKLGTAADQKLGLWGATPVVQPASANQAVLALDVDVTGADTVDKAAINTNFTAIQTLVNQLRLDLIAAGVIKGSA